MRPRWPPCGPRIGVVVPTWNEAPRIAEQVRHLRGLDVCGVWVADAGSPDGTARIAAEAGATVVPSPRGRGRQLGAGAAAADADVLWFVHADVRVPDDGPAQVRRALADPTVVGGAFRTRTVSADGRFPRLLRLADLRASYTSRPYGDQAVFVRRDAYLRVGGFPAQPLFEDVELARRLARVGRLAILPGPVLVSGRRFLAQPMRAMVAMNVLPLAYRLGVDPARLERWYGAPR